MYKTLGFGLLGTFIAVTPVALSTKPSSPCATPGGFYYRLDEVPQTLKLRGGFYWRYADLPESFRNCWNAEAGVMPRLARPRK